MSKYTTELRYICESLAGYEENKGYTSVGNVISNSRTKIFNFSYPIFDANYKAVLETKILKHYYGREIGTETFGRWQLWLDTRMNEIMPYYNKLYTSELLEFNPLYDVDLTTDHVKRGTSESEGESANTGTVSDEGNGSRNRTDNLTRTSQDGGTEQLANTSADKNTRRDYYSDTPQGAITGVENETYLTNFRKIVDDGTGSTSNSTTTFGKTVTDHDTGTQNIATTDNNTRTLNTKLNSTDNIETTEDYLEHVKGKSGGASFSKLLEDYRKTFLNIDMMIIHDLSDLFFGLW